MYTRLTLGLALILSLSVHAEKITYEDHIKDIFQNSCSNCHKPSKRKGGLNLMVYADVLKGGSSGKIVEPGDVESLLVKCVTHEEEPVMPPKGDKLENGDIELIRSWIKGGLLETANSKRIKVSTNTSLAQATPVVAKGTVILPQYLNLQPYLETPRANAVTAMSASPYSPLVAAGGYKQVLLFNTERLSLTGVLPFPEGLISDVKFSRDGSMVMASGGIHGKKGIIVLWDVKSGKRLFKLDNDYDTTMAADISSDRNFIASGSSDKLIKIYSAKDGSLKHKIKQHSEWITSVSFSPDAVLLATGDRNGHIHVWECESGQKMYSLMRHKAKITSLSWRSDSNLLASSSEDGDVVIWSITNGKEAKRFKAHSSGTTDVFYSNNGSLVTAGRDRYLKFWDSGYKQKKSMKLPNSFALRAVATPDSKYAVSADYNGNLALWNIDTQKQMRTAWANPPNLDERIKLNASAVLEAEKQIKASLASVESAKKPITYYNGKNKQMADTKNKIKAGQDKINKLRGQLGKLKGDDRKKAEQEIAAQDKAKKALEKQYPLIIKEVNKLKSQLSKMQKTLSDRTKVHQANITELKFLKDETVRWQAEKVNVERHKVIGEINKLTEEEMNAKATRESLKFVISDNLKKAEELKKLGDKIEKAETEDEALDTLVNRFETQVRLKKDAVDSEKKIEELKVRESDIQKSLPILKEKEKKILGDYLERLPRKEKDQKVSSK